MRILPPVEEKIRRNSVVEDYIKKRNQLPLVG
jgi:hypothetical protein